MNKEYVVNQLEAIRERLDKLLLYIETEGDGEQ